MDFSHIVKAYDVRGVFPDELDEEAARRLGAAFAERQQITDRKP